MKLYLLLAFLGLAFASDEYIIGGTEVATRGKWPWQGSLRKYGSHICGLSLISSTWGLTAAHCVDGSSASQLSFGFGMNDRYNPVVTVQADSIIMHEDYDCWGCAGTFPNDIAVVKFNKAVSGSYISTIPMANKNTDHAGNSDCWITGWGYKVHGTTLPTMLQEAKINVYSNQKCKETWGSGINPGHVCIGDSANGRGSCNGDSGGPLVCKVSGRYELVGATSWGITGCKTTHPSVYSRVAYFRDWVKGKTGI